MDDQRIAEYQKHRDEIWAWSQEFDRALEKAVSTGSAPPSPKAPASTNDAYRRVLRMVEEDGVSGSAFWSLPPGDLTIASALTVVEGLDMVLGATRKG